MKLLLCRPRNSKFEKVLPKLAATVPVSALWSALWAHMLPMSARQDQVQHEDISIQCACYCREF